MGTNITMTRGDTVSLTLAVTLSGDPFPLGGSSLWFTVKTKFTDNDDEAILQKTIGSGIDVTGPDQGLATITILPIDTSGLSAVKTILVWDVQLKDGDGKIYTISSGNLIVNPDVTISVT